MAALGLSTPSHRQVPRWGWKQREKCLVHGKLPACNPCLATPTVSGVQMSATAKGQDGSWVIWSSLVTQVPHSWDLCLRGASLGRTLPCQQGFLNIDWLRPSLSGCQDHSLSPQTIWGLSLGYSGSLAICFLACALSPAHSTRRIPGYPLWLPPNKNVLCEGLP